MSTNGSGAGSGGAPFPRVERLVLKSVPFVGVLSMTLAVLFTWLSGLPAKLPGIALSSNPLFYVERGAVGFAALTIAAGLFARALSGDIPIGFSTTGVTYAAKAANALNDRLEKLETDNDNSHERLRELKILVKELGAEKLQAGAEEHGAERSPDA